MIKIILSLFLISNAIANPCGQIFQGNLLLKSAKDVKLYKSAFLMDRLTKKMKTYNKSMADIELSLLQGDSDLAINKFTHTFRKTESSYLELERLKKLIGNTDKREFTLLKTYRKDFDRYSKVLGNNFEKYQIAKDKLTSLSKSPNCSIACKKAIKQVNKQTSIIRNEYNSFYRDLIGKRKTLPLRSIRSSFLDNPKAFVVAKRKTFVNNIGNKLFTIFQNKLLLRSILSGVKTSEFLGRVLRTNRLIGLFKRAYNVRYFLKHKLPLVKIAYSGNSPVQKISALENDLTGLDLDDFLTDYSRSNDSRIQNSFDKIYSHLTETQSNKALLARFDQAKAIGLKLGKISSTKPKNLSWLVGSIVLAGAGYGYFTFEKSSEVTSEISNDDQIQEIENDGVIVEVEFDSEDDNAILEEFIEVNESVTVIEEQI